MLRSRCFECTKPQVRSGTHRDLDNSDAKVAVLNAKIHRWGLGPIETSNSDAKVPVLHAKTTEVRAGTHRQA